MTFDYNVFRLDDVSLRFEAAHNLSLIYEQMGERELAREVIMNNNIV